MSIQWFERLVGSLRGPGAKRSRKRLNDTLRPTLRRRHAFHGFESLEERRVLAAVLGIGTGALVGNDLTDVGNNGVEGSYSAPSNLAGFDGVFFANLKPNFGSFQAAFNVFDNRAGGAGDDKALWGFPAEPNQLQPMIVGANFATTHGPTVLTSFTITSGEDTPERDPTRWKIEGSNDTTTGLNGTWTTIYDKAVGGSHWTQRQQVNRYSPADGDVFLTSQPFTAFRMVTTATGIWTMGTVQGNKDLFQLSEIEFFGVPGNSSPAVNLSVSSATGTEAGTTAITVNATAASAVSGDQTVTLAVTGTGLAASDYGLSNSTITIPNGATSGSITFSVKDDLLSEGTETATLTISSPSAGISLGTTLTQNITITDDDSAGTSTYGLPVTGAYRAVRNGSTIEIYNSTPVLVTSRAMGTAAVVINGTSGNDSLTVDLSGGSFTVPITFNGGSQTSTPGDSLALTGGTFNTGTFAFTNANDGTINLTGNSQISYTGLEPIVTTGTTIHDLILTFNGGAETITLTDASGAAMTIDSLLSESLTFANPSSSLTINAGTGDDLVNITSVDTAFNASLTINGDANNDTVTLTPALSLASLTIIAETINVNSGTVTTTGSQSYNGPVNLGTNTTLATANVTFASTVNSSSPASLIVNASGSGLVTFSGNVGGTAPLSTLTVNAINVTAAAIATTTGVSVNNTGTASNISGAITGAGATLTKAGAGTLTLSGSNLYTGATNINAGTLRTAATTSAPAGAVGIYTFDSVSGATVSNAGSAGVGKNGALVAGSAVVGGGRIGNAMSTSGGSGARMEIAGAGISLAGGNWTGAAWFNNLFTDGDWNTLFVDSNAGDAQVIIQNGTNRLGVYTGEFRSSGFDLVPAANSGWHHVAAVGSGTTTTFYRNGVLVGTADRKSGTNITSVGASPAGGGMQRFAQLIDDVYIYQSALTAAQIMTLYNSGAGTAANSIPDSSTVTIAGGAFLDLNGSSETIGSLDGAGTVTSGIAGAPTLTVGNGNGSGSFSGAVQNGAGTVSLAKSGTGTQTLSGSNLYTGATSVNTGTLVINGSVTSNVTVTTPGVLNGSGTVTGNVLGNGTFSPGNSPGIMTIVGNFTPSGTVNFEVNSAWTTAGTHFDQYLVTGLVNMAGSTVTFTNTVDASGPAANSVIKLIDNNGTLDLTTAPTTPVNGALITIGSRSFRLFYNGGDGNDVTLESQNAAPTAANASVTTNEDFTYTFSATDFNFGDTDSGDVLSAVKITTVESSGDLEWFDGSSWVDVTQDQEISKADIDANRLRFVPAANANGSPYATFSFKVQDTGGPVLSVAAYTLAINVSAVDDAPVLTINDTSTYVENAVPTVVAPNLTLTDPDGPNINGATVSLTTNFNSAQDRLQFTNQNGISGSYNAATGILSLSGSASAASYQTALRSVTYSNISQNPTTGERSVQFSVGNSTLANPANGHFYEFVSAQGGSWASAKAAAESRTLFGLQGYLATVTSASENAFIAGKLIGQGWMGGSDAEVEGTWRWVTGPEAGQQFWQGAGGGSAVNGMYNNWTPGEPNNFGPFGEDYAHFRVGADWNDYRVDNGATQGYVVEYGGMPGDPMLLQLIGTSTVIVVAVNDAPVAQTSSVTTNEDTAMTFAVSDFLFTDVEGDSVTSITISSLNLASDDSLKLSGADVTVGQTITAADISNLVYAPFANANGLARSTFGFTANDAGSGTVAATMTIDVTAVTDVSIGDASATEGGNLQFNVSLDRPLDVDAVITYSTANGSATTADSDYTSQTLQTLTIPAGQTSGTITLVTTSDNKVELDETMTVQLTGIIASGRDVTIDDGSGQGMILNDDTATVSIGDASATEGGNLQFNVSLDRPLDVDAVITYSTADGSATTADSDYASQTLQTLTIPAGQTNGTIIIVTTADNKVELDETLTVQLTGVNASGRNVTIDDGSGQGMMLNDDTATVSINNPSVIETNSGTTTLAFMVSLDKPVDVAVSATINTANGITNPATIADSDYVALTNGTVTFSAGSTTSQTVNVTINGDSKLELNEQLQLVLSALSASGRNVQFTGAAATLTAIGTITNDDTPRVGSILQPTSVTTTMGAFSSAWAATKMIDKSGLSVGYTSNVTNFDTYIAGNPTHSYNAHQITPADAQAWASSNSVLTGTITFNLGSMYAVESMALWNRIDAGIGGFNLLADADGDFNSGAVTVLSNRTALLGRSGAQVFGFTPTTAQYFRLQVLSDAHSFPFVIINEIAFEGAQITVDATPPTSQITALAPNSSSLVIPITVTGSDGGPLVSGVKEYDLYYSTGGGFVKFATVPASSPSTTFTGAANTTYWFRSLGRDNAGNEETKTTSDTSTRFGDVAPPATQVTTAVPTSGGLFTVSMTGSKATGSALAAFDVYVSIDGGAAALIRSANAVSLGGGNYSGKIPFQGILDGTSHTYRFYSRGRDDAGNVEAAPVVADLSVTHSFASAGLKATAIDVQKGANQRSYVRSVDVLFSSATGLSELLGAGRVKVERFGLDATSVNPGTGSLVTGFALTQDDKSLRLDFGANGLGGLNQAGNGFYRILIDQDGNNSFSDPADTAFEFFRLWGDANGDGKVDSTDLGLVTSQVGRVGNNVDGDLDGNGVVNSLDRLFATQQNGKKLRDSLFGWLDD